ncbi:MAG: hypothetical protein EA001_12340 [Oscillatoriales cyanobacterium]|nr:MAG: hypothetical protein EA001_12340 [Oscillatoriales cyanobacterium]
MASSPWQRVASVSLSVGAVLTLGGAIALVTTGFAVGVRSIVDPEAAAWLEHWLPEPSGATTRDLKTVAQLRSELNRATQRMGEILPLGQQWLVATVRQQQPNCKAGAACWPIVQLRAYQAQPTAQTADRPAVYRLITTLDLQGPPESLVLATLAANDSGSTRPLPLATVQGLKGGPAGGGWLTVGSVYRSAAGTAHYGTIVHLNVSRVGRLGNLSIQTQWSSPKPQPPRWESITGNREPELVIDRSPTDAPDLAIYRVVPSGFAPDPIQLAQVSLSEPVFRSSELADWSQYQDAIALARVGLWSPALNKLQPLRDRLVNRSLTWDDRVQAQYDTIRYHAELARARADSPQPDRLTQIAADLGDSRWQKAIDRFEQGSAAEQAALVRWLRSANGERLDRQIDLVLKFAPNQASVMFWKSTLLAARQGRPAAIGWYRSRPGQSPELDARIDRWLAQVALIPR